jgi:predicted phosphodiesterase
VTPWAAQQLRADQVELLAGLPHPVTVEIEGSGSVLFCHGTPRDDEEVVLVDTRLEKWQEVLAGVSAQVRTVVCGHTHMPFLRLVDRRLVVNAGSIGMPYGHVGGSWALLRDGAVMLRRTLVDVGAAVARVVAESTYPGRQEWADYFLRARASDADALRIFGPRDGRATT